ncbi:10992_t:CDS:10 [Entrophospora sp. SA101]|nr:10992_t:CDS:10 [Entrophospora sp. SA101]
MDILKHRSVQTQSIQKIANSIAKNPGNAKTRINGGIEPSFLEQLWSFITPEHTGVVSLHAVNKLISLVTIGAIPWEETLNHLTDLLSTSSGDSKFHNVIITGITDLLINHLDGNIDSVEYKSPFNSRARNYEGKIDHPFIIVANSDIIKLEETWLILISHLERIFDLSRVKFSASQHIMKEKRSLHYLINCLEMMKPFLDFVILNGLQQHNKNYRSLTIIQLLIRLMYKYGIYEIFIKTLMNYLLSITQSLSFIDDNVNTYIIIQSLVQIININNKTNSILNECSSNLLNQMFNITCDLINNDDNLSITTTNNYIPLIYQLLILDDGKILIADLEKGEIRNLAMVILFRLQKFQNLKINQNFLSKELSSEIYNLSSSTFQNKKIQKSNNTQINLLFHIPYLFHENDTSKIEALDYLTSVITEDMQMAKSLKLPIFLLLLYILRNDISSSIHLHILYDSLPSLITRNDPIITTKIFKVITNIMQEEELNLNNNDGIYYYKLSTIGIRVLFKCWKRQKRCWEALISVISNWVEDRLLKTSIDIKREDFELEISILSTIRDICKIDAVNYSEELIPLISSLLQSTILHPISLCLVIDTLNTCIEANAADIYEVWNKFIIYIAEIVKINKISNLQVISMLCNFYQLVAKHDDDCEEYEELKNEVLSKHMYPLISTGEAPNSLKDKENDNVDDEQEKKKPFEFQKNQEILKCALKALSFFSATCILSTIFSKQPKIIVNQISHSKYLSQIDEWKFVLSNLISYEIENMSRTLFKVKGSLFSISSKIIESWESGKVVPGLRVGYSLATLNFFESSLPLSSSTMILDKEEQQKKDDLVNKIEFIKSTKFYKLLMNVIQDVNLTDHWMIRIGVIAEWTKFFENGLQEIFSITINSQNNFDFNNEEEIINILKDDLIKLLSETSLCLALRSLNNVSKEQYAANILRCLRDNYFVDGSFQDTVEKHENQDISLITSDEVQFSVMISLGYLTTLASFPTRTPEMENNCSQTIQFLEEYFFQSNNNPETESPVLLIDSYLGFMLGLSGVNHEEVKEVKTIYQKALSDLKKFVELNGKVENDHKRRILGSAWFVAFSKFERYDENIIELFEKLTKWTGYDVHFTQTYCYVLQTVLLIIPIRAILPNLQKFNAQLSSQIEVLSSPGSNSKKRQNAILALGSLSGVIYPHNFFYEKANSYLFKSRPFTVINQVLDTLKNIAGVPSSSPSSTVFAGAAEIMIKDVKGARLAAIILGKMTQSVDKLLVESNDVLIKSVSKNIADTEPKNYSRLPNSSYLKFLFVALTDVTDIFSSKSRYVYMNSPESTISIESAQLFFSTLMNVNQVFPPVNWFPLLVEFNKPNFKQFKLHIESIKFAIKYCDWSASLTEYLMYVLMKFPDIQVISDDGDDFNSGDLGFEEILVNDGIAKILQLYGFEKNENDIITEIKRPTTSSSSSVAIKQRRGINDILKKSTIHDSRLLEIFDVLFEKLFEKVENKYLKIIKGLQIKFLRTINYYIPSNDKTSNTEDYLTITQQELIKRLKKHFYNFKISDLKEQDVYIIQLFTKTCMFSNDDIIKGDQLYENEEEFKKYVVTICTMVQLNRVDSKYLINLLQEKIFDVLFEKLFEKVENKYLKIIKGLQIKFLRTINYYIPSNDKTSNTEDYLTITQQELIKRLKKHFYNFKISDLKEQDVYIIQLFTKTCMFSNDDIIKGDQLYENEEEFKKYVVTICTMVQLNRVDSKYLINLLQESLSHSSNNKNILIFSWILFTIHFDIFNNTKKSNKKKILRSKLEWLVNLMDVLIIVTNSPNQESSSINKIWYYGINLVMNGLINLSWCEDDVNIDNIIDGNNGGATTLANAMINSCFIDCQIFDENFMRIFNNPVIVKQLPNLIIKEIQQSVDMDDNGFNTLNEKVTKRFLQLFENLRKDKANEASHIFWEILNRLRSPKIGLISDNESWVLFEY